MFNIQLLKFNDLKFASLIASRIHPLYFHVVPSKSNVLHTFLKSIKIN